MWFLLISTIVVWETQAYTGMLLGCNLEHVCECSKHCTSTNLIKNLFDLGRRANIDSDSPNSRSACKCKCIHLYQIALNETFSAHRMYPFRNSFTMKTIAIFSFLKQQFHSPVVYAVCILQRIATKMSGNKQRRQNTRNAVLHIV